MNLLRLLPVVFSFLLISAHFQRAEETLLSVTCLFAPCLLCITNPWSVRIIQAALLLATGEWIRTLLSLVQLRQEMALPWARLTIILFLVALLTSLSVLVFRLQPLRKRYRL